MKSLKLIFGFIMGLCLTATMTSCDDDEDNGVSVPQEVLSAMPGTYVNSMEYGEATADSAMTVTLGTADMQFNLPVSNIIKDVVAAENLEQALNTYKADTCSVSYRISGYANCRRGRYDCIIQRGGQQADADTQHQERENRRKTS